MTDEQRVYLWQAYRFQVSEGGPARDNIPYTPHFDVIVLRLNTRFGTTHSPNLVFAELSRLDRHPETRTSLGIEA